MARAPEGGVKEDVLETACRYVQNAFIACLRNASGKRADKKVSVLTERVDLCKKYVTVSKTLSAQQKYLCAMYTRYRKEVDDILRQQMRAYDGILQNLAIYSERIVHAERRRADYTEAPLPADATPLQRVCRGTRTGACVVLLEELEHAQKLYETMERTYASNIGELNEKRMALDELLVELCHQKETLAAVVRWMCDVGAFYSTVSEKAATATNLEMDWITTGRSRWTKEECEAATNKNKKTQGTSGSVGAGGSGCAQTSSDYINACTTFEMLLLHVYTEKGVFPSFRDVLFSLDERANLPDREAAAQRLSRWKIARHALEMALALHVAVESNQPINGTRPLTRRAMELYLKLGMDAAVMMPAGNVATIDHSWSTLNNVVEFTREETEKLEKMVDWKYEAALAGALEYNQKISQTNKNYPFPKEKLIAISPESLRGKIKKQGEAIMNKLLSGSPRTLQTMPVPYFHVVEKDACSEPPLIPSVEEVIFKHSPEQLVCKSVGLDYKTLEDIRTCGVPVMELAIIARERSQARAAQLERGVDFKAHTRPCKKRGGTPPQQTSPHYVDARDQDHEQKRRKLSSDAESPKESGACGVSQLVCTSSDGAAWSAAHVPLVRTTSAFDPSDMVLINKVVDAVKSVVTNHEEWLNDSLGKLAKSIAAGKAQHAPQKQLTWISCGEKRSPDPADVQLPLESQVSLLGTPACPLIKMEPPPSSPSAHRQGLVDLQEVEQLLMSQTTNTHPLGCTDDASCKEQIPAAERLSPARLAAQQAFMSVGAGVVTQHQRPPPHQVNKHPYNMFLTPAQQQQYHFQQQQQQQQQQQLVAQVPMLVQTAPVQTSQYTSYQTTQTQTQPQTQPQTQSHPQQYSVHKLQTHAHQPSSPGQLRLEGRPKQILSQSSMQKILYFPLNNNSANNNGNDLS